MVNPSNHEGFVGIVPVPHVESHKMVIWLVHISLIMNICSVSILFTYEYVGPDLFSVGILAKRSILVHLCVTRK